MAASLQTGWTWQLHVARSTLVLMPMVGDGVVCHASTAEYLQCSSAKVS